MTKIVILEADGITACGWFLDEREPRELLIAINTGEFQPKCKGLPVDGPVSAKLVGDPRFVAVMPAPPKVDLYPRLYHVLWCASEGQKASQVAEGLGISVRTVYAYHQELKRRFDARSMYVVIMKAAIMGFI